MSRGPSEDALGRTASARQVAANRQNARLACGPRSVEGKRAASLNALRHGLAAQTSPGIWSPVVKELTDLIDLDIGQREVSEKIACTLIDLERTLATMQALALKQSAGLAGFFSNDDIEQIESDRALAADLLSIVYAHVEDPDLVLRERNLMKYFMTMGRRFETRADRSQKSSERNAFAEAASLRRYFKRASNQFIKALKVATRPEREVSD